MPIEPLSREGGRRADQLREYSLETGVLDFAAGSVLAKCGRTRVLCSASIAEGVPPFLAGRGQGWLTAEYAMLPHATHTRSVRESVSGRPQGRSQEIQRLIGRSLRGAVDLRRLGEITITVDCDVLQADGGTRTTAVTGAYLAVALGVLRTLGRDAASLVTPVAAVSVGVVGGELLIDLDYAEDSSATVDLNVVMNGRGDYIELQATAEQGGGIARGTLTALLDMAEAGLHQLFQLQARSLEAAVR